MDPQGNIVDTSKLTPIPDDQLDEVQKMNRKERRKWLAQQRRKAKPKKRKKKRR